MDSSSSNTQLPIANAVDTPLPSTSSEEWTVTPVWSTGGDDDSSYNFAKGLQDSLNRTKTYPVLSDVLFRPIVAILVVAWTFVLWRKLRNTSSKASWPDAAGPVVLAICVWRKWMVAAIGLTAAYAAWSTLADRPWSATSKLPSFEAFIAKHRPVRQSQSQNPSPSPSPNNDNSVLEPVAPAEPGSEAAALASLEAKLGLPEKKPDQDCVVCWSSDETPVQLPCSHLVCEDCLVRLKEANRYLCPFCRQPLFSLQDNKVLLFQLAVATAGAQLAISLVLAALQIASSRYWAAGGTLLMYAFVGGSFLYGQKQIVARGEEGYFASTSTRTLGFTLALSLYNVKACVGGMDKVDWATFTDGVWVRWSKDEWQQSREFLCWLVPEVAGRVLRC